ncbi:AMP-dependent synthetase/ligase [Runella slithyformis]|uniref:Long-chain-fatty-acid--CoA ligase n=1 Tax=Runella slithyformis (strain ATCC 29530 / DSM 19594 / LMG 11500 / NCIMB 11436 / LSU 4) TaxID=761193 RepID=A0A7U3ZR45_RUNSL|nr:long-chain fatty acid--CoA ligase [Runella slithyformis]AEI51788.1 Long-chain-fatty-acid--CoA ligase [Runella slithyformis DSM 19594]
MQTGATRLFDLLDLYVKPQNKPDTLACKRHGEWVTFSSQQFCEEVDKVSLGLLQLGVQAGDRIAIVSDGRPEWNIVDFGIQQVGAISVPIYPTLTLEDFHYIFHEAEVKFVFVGDAGLFRKLIDVVATAPTVEEMYTFDAVKSAKNLTEVTSKANEANRPKLEERKAAIQPDDLLSIIYTSGTTGDPKGVMITHRNILSNAEEGCKLIAFGTQARALSFLPLNHVFERMVQYVYLRSGISIYYAENVATIAENLREVHPTVLSTVPRLLEKVYDKIIAKGYEQPRLSRNIFLWALEVGLKYDPNKDMGVWYNAQLKLARKLVFRKWKEALGGKLEMIVAGAAATPPRIARVFWAAGIPVCEGYGLTETSPVIAFNRLFPKQEVRIGTVGIVIDGVEVKLADDGEILVKGPNVMKGYYRKPHLTAEVITADGWFHTGDIGQWVDTKFLKLTDRKKEIFKTSAGKYVAPQVVEAKLKESFFIEQSVVVGEGQKFAGALIIPSFEAIKEFCRIENLTYTSDAEIITHEKVAAKLRAEVEEANHDLAPYERIKKYHLLSRALSVENGELTPTLKPKRRIIQEKYKAEIDAMFR